MFEIVFLSWQWKVWRCSNIWMSNDVSIWIRAPVAPSYSLWIYLFFPLPAQCICFYPHECICFSLWIYLCVFAGGIPASLSHIPGSQPVVIHPSVDMSEFVELFPTGQDIHLNREGLKKFFLRKKISKQLKWKNHKTFSWKKLMCHIMP